MKAAGLVKTRCQRNWQKRVRIWQPPSQLLPDVSADAKITKHHVVYVAGMKFLPMFGATCGVCCDARFGTNGDATFGTNVDATFAPKADATISPKVDARFSTKVDATFSNHFDSCVFFVFA